MRFIYRYMFIYTYIHIYIYIYAYRPYQPLPSHAPTNARITTSITNSLPGALFIHISLLQGGSGDYSPLRHRPQIAFICRDALAPAAVARYCRARRGPLPGRAGPCRVPAPPGPAGVSAR